MIFSCYLDQLTFQIAQFFLLSTHGINLVLTHDSFLMEKMDKYRTVMTLRRINHCRVGAHVNEPAWAVGWSMAAVVSWTSWLQDIVDWDLSLCVLASYFIHLHFVMCMRGFSCRHFSSQYFDGNALIGCWRTAAFTLILQEVSRPNVLCSDVCMKKHKDVDLFQEDSGSAYWWWELVEGSAIMRSSRDCWGWLIGCLRLKHRYVKEGVELKRQCRLPLIIIDAVGKDSLVFRVWNTRHCVQVKGC